MPGIITSLRDLVPIRPLSVVEAMRVGELQAGRLLELSGVTEAPVPESAIARLPRLQIDRITPSPVSGATEWRHGRWLIVVNGAEPVVRQRYSIFHEFKHVLDNPFIQVLYPTIRGMSEHDRAEQMCDYFAAAVLMPRRWLKATWTSGTQDVGTLARRFDVSKMAMQVRLQQVGLTQPGERCDHRPRRQPGTRTAAVRQARSNRLLAMLENTRGMDPAFLERLAEVARSNDSQVRKD